MLSVENVSVAYGRAIAVHDASLDVGAGEIVALIGANGAGKSSLMKAVAGVVPPRSGVIRLAGKRIDGLPPHRAAALGIALVPEGRMIFGELSVGDNLLAGTIGRLARLEIDKRRAAVLAQFPMLRERLSERASGLSGGEQQLLALARGLMGAPRLLLLDEPSLGLSPVATDQIFDMLLRLKAAGQTVLLVEQNVELALEVADRAYIMEAGTISREGPAGELRDDPAVERAYLSAII